MTITIGETSREFSEGDNPYAIIKYVIRGTTDDIVAKNLLYSVAPAIHDGLIKRTWVVDETGPGTGIWEGTVRYGLIQQQPETGQSVYQFDTGGGTQHITQSRATVGAYAPPGKTAPNFGGAIGVTKDSVEGVDIVVPVYNWSETHYIPCWLVTESYKNLLADMTSTINNTTFRGYAPGVVIFNGASGSQRGQEDWEITYRFSASPNQTGLVIGEITGINKNGWDYLWVRYQDAEDDDAKAIVKKPMAVYVEQVYRYTDFWLLGIG